MLRESVPLKRPHLNPLPEGEKRRTTLRESVPLKRPHLNPLPQAKHKLGEMRQTQEAFSLRASTRRAAARLPGRWPSPP